MKKPYAWNRRGEKDWDDPTEGGSRTFYGLCAFLVGALGIAGIYFSIQELIHPQKNFIDSNTGADLGAKQVPIVGLVVMLVLAFVPLGVAVAFFIDELKKLRKGDMSLENIVAGMFLLAIAFGALGFEVLAPGRRAPYVATVGDSSERFPIFIVLLGVGACTAVVALLLGIAIAFFPRLDPRVRTWTGVSVEKKYAIDSSGQVFDNFPEPERNGMHAFVILNVQGGKLLHFRCAVADYAGLRSGMVINAKTRGDKIKSFEK